MAIWREEKNDCFIIHVDEPEPNERDIDRIRQVLTVAFLNQKYKLIFDLSSCQMINSFFIGLLIGTYREITDLGGTMVISGVSPEVMSVLKIIRLDDVMEIFPSIDEAVAQFQS